MTTFNDAIEAQLDGAVVRVADLVRLDFKSGEVRVHGGFGKLKDGNGEIWQGVGRLGRLSMVSAGPGQAADELTLSLFGSADMLAKLEADTAEATGREVRRYLQFFDVRRFDDAGRWVDWQPLDEPLQIFWGTMGAPIVDRPALEAGSKSAAQRSISVRAINAFVNRRKPRFSFYSHRDQQARTGSADNIFIRASRMADATVSWPSGLA